MDSLSKIPLSGGFLLALAAYILVSLLAGQEIGERMVDKSGWYGSCQSVIQRDIRDRAPISVPQAPTDCNSTFGWLHPDIGRLCNEFGNPDLRGPNGRALDEAERLRKEREAERRARAAEGAASRCECATNLYLQEEMVALGLYAGTARLVSRPAVRDQLGELTQRLYTPTCDLFTGGY